MSLIRTSLIALTASTLFMVSTVLAIPAESAPAEKTTKGLSAKELATVKGEVGVAVLDTARNKQFLLNQNKLFPMQSVYKLPISIAILRLADEGKLSIKDKVTVYRKDVIPTNSPIKNAFKGDQSDFTIKELISRNISDSDNTACDALINHVGGTSEISRILAEAGIKGIRVDRPIKDLHTDGQEIAEVLADPRDTAAPETMIELLQKLYNGSLLSRESTAELLDDLFNCKTGLHRLKAGLPAGWKLAHKTGTGQDIAGKNVATNDVGVMVGPKGETIFIAVFTKGSQAKAEVRDALIAKIAAKAAAGNLENQ